MSWRDALPRLGIFATSDRPAAGLAAALAAGGERVAALEAYRELLLATPDDLSLLNALSLLLGRLGRDVDGEGVDGEGPRFTDAFVLAADWRADSNLEPKPDYDPALRIDHVFLAGAPWQASDWVVDQWGYGGTMHYTSDHFAIAVVVAVP